MNSNSKYCRTCSEHESEHHLFEPYLVPTGCVCHPMDWLTEIIPPICGTYVPDDDVGYGYCLTCDHVEECHKNV